MSRQRRTVTHGANDVFEAGSSFQESILAVGWEMNWKGKTECRESVTGWLPGGPRERGWWSKSEQTAVNVLCLCQALESGWVDEAGSEGDQTKRPLQLRAPESRWETPAESSHPWQALVILRSEPKSSGVEAKPTFLPTKGSGTAFWRR